MEKSSRLRYWTIKLLKIALLVEVAWVVLVNVLLQIPFTQDVINMIRPEKFSVRWVSAWTFYPFRVHVREASANGDARTQSWQVDVAAASGSINPLPLVLKKVALFGVRASDVDYRQRPRYKPDRDYSDIEPYFPEIEGREPSDAITTPRKKKRPWRVVIDDAEVEGHLDYWLFNFRGTADGKLGGRLDYRTPGGPLELDVEGIDLDLGQLRVNGEQEVFPGGKVTGSVRFDPFRPSEDKGLALLGFLGLDLDVDIDVNSLRFVNLFLLDLKGLEVDGRGRVNGQLRYDRGSLVDGTDLDILANDLQVRFGGHLIDGDGMVGLYLGKESGGDLDLRFDYNDLSVRLEDDPEPLMVGSGLRLLVGGDARIQPEPGKLNESRVLRLLVEELLVPDIGRFQHYLPAGSPFRLSGGESRFAADIGIGAHDADGWCRLQSDGVSGNTEIQEVRGDLLVDITVAGGSLVQRMLDIAGSRVVLDEVRVVGEEQGYDDEAWAMELLFAKGVLSLDNPPAIDAVAELAATDSRPIVAMFMNQDGWRPDFMARALTLEHIEGTAELLLADKRLRIPEALVTSDNVEARMKGIITEEGMDAALYLKARKVGAMLEIEQDTNRLRLIKPLQKYEDYTVDP